MITRSRSAPTAAATSIECTTSANSTVTCLYSAGVVAVATPAAHSLENVEFGGSSVPHDPRTKAAAVIYRGHPTRSTSLFVKGLTCRLRLTVVTNGDRPLGST